MTGLPERLLSLASLRDVKLPLTTQIVLASMDDLHSQAIVDFGNPTRAMLITCDVHPVLWVCYTEMVPLDRERSSESWHEYDFTRFERNWRILGAPAISAVPRDEREPEVAGTARSATLIHGRVILFVARLQPTPLTVVRVP